MRSSCATCAPGRTPPRTALACTCRPKHYRRRPFDHDGRRMAAAGAAGGKALRRAVVYRPTGAARNPEAPRCRAPPFGCSTRTWTPLRHWASVRELTGGGEPGRAGAACQFVTSAIAARRTLVGPALGAAPGPGTTRPRPEGEFSSTPPFASSRRPSRAAAFRPAGPFVAHRLSGPRPSGPWDRGAARRFALDGQAPRGSLLVSARASVRARSLPRACAKASFPGGRPGKGPRWRFAAFSAFTWPLRWSAKPSPPPAEPLLEADRDRLLGRPRAVLPRECDASLLANELCRPGRSYLFPPGAFVPSRACFNRVFFGQASDPPP